MKTFKSDFNFGKVKEHLATLTDTKDKIKYLIEQKNEYLQTRTWVDWDKTVVHFDKQCQMEINTLKTLLEMYSTPVQSMVTLPIEPIAIEKPILENIPVKWTGTPGQLVYVFEQLRDKDFLPTSTDLQATIRKHFVDNEGKTFTNLKQSKQNYLNSNTGKPRRADELETLVDKAKEGE
jgi:hypothetical protein